MLLRRALPRLTPIAAFHRPCHFCSATSAPPTAPAALVVAETRNGSLTPGTLSAVTFARTVVGEDGNVELLVDNGNENELPEMPKIEGVVVCDYGKGVAERVSRGVTNTLERRKNEFGWVVGNGGSLGKSVMARVAGVMGVMGVGDVVGVQKIDIEEKNRKNNGKWAYRRFVYAGAGLETVRVLGGKAGVFTIRSTGFEKAKVVGKWEGKVTQAHSGEDDGRVKIVKEVGLGDGVELGSARVVVAGGRGLKKEEHFGMLTKLAELLKGGAVGATRAAVDLGWCPNDMQVGQTGKIVAPELYVGIGLSGAIQHLAGMKESKCIVAINKDGKAPIFQVADYGLVGDLFDVVPELTDKLEKLEVRAGC